MVYNTKRNILMHIKHRSLFSIVLLDIITLGLYSIYWFFITKTEMNTINAQSAKVPFFLWFFVPIINIWWFYRFCKAMNVITRGSLGVWVAFFAPIILYFAAMFILNMYSQYLVTSLTQTNLYFALFSIILSAIVSTLPILYYQSNLNKVAR